MQPLSLSAAVQQLSLSGKALTLYSRSVTKTQRFFACKIADVARTIKTAKIIVLSMRVIALSGNSEYADLNGARPDAMKPHHNVCGEDVLKRSMTSGIDHGSRVREK